MFLYLVRRPGSFLVPKNFLVNAVGAKFVEDALRAALGCIDLAKTVARYTLRTIFRLSLPISR
jgi:hypothetical protein